MKIILGLLSTVILSLNSSAQCSDLFFSEYVEGSSNNKAFEIYNPTTSAIDLSNYVVYRNNNGSPTPSDSLFPIGILAAGDVFVVVNYSAIAPMLALADTLHTMTFYNGDDALYIKNITTGDTIDLIGEIGVDPGASWPVGSGATQNFTLIRQITIQEGSTDWAIGATQWDVYPIDMIDSLGFHTMTPCCMATSSTLNETACDSYTSPSGNYIWTSSSTYLDTIPNISGCDSVITINLTINTVNPSVTQSGFMLTADETGATYQWVNCPGMTAISGATNQSYTASSNGDYAVIVTLNGCTDTSTCYTVSGIGIDENDFGSGIQLYPNPARDQFLIDLGEMYPAVTVTLSDLTGKTVQTETYLNTQQILMNLEEAPGIYMVWIQAGNKTAVVRLIKE